MAPSFMLAIYSYHPPALAIYRQRYMHVRFVGFIYLQAVYVQPSCMCVCPFTTSTDLHVHLLVERASDPCIWPDIYTAKDCFVFYVDSCIFTTSVVGNWESSRGPTLSGACPVGVDRHLEHW
ncbi:hypothetical protein SORBI_3001G005400 [Sorghum bicolor]|uniref:Uncharacterized protein n=1 Tax=Sorghum bicolor TaxID=4558 RepID=A0A1Z5S4C3_SORBI|nr:hypothetical protein SORBI_3001G005400 [Sorghum bicolor]OQU90597.1 hypothetical protein SORBI_3001G005400 [Sorghum bicolor]